MALGLENIPLPQLSLGHVWVTMCHVKLGPSGGGDQFVILIWGKHEAIHNLCVKSFRIFRGKRGTPSSEHRETEGLTRG
jgi:hypothetical protein